MIWNPEGKYIRRVTICIALNYDMKKNGEWCFLN